MDGLSRTVDSPVRVYLHVMHHPIIIIIGVIAIDCHCRTSLILRCSHKKRPVTLVDVILAFSLVVGSQRHSRIIPGEGQLSTFHGVACRSIHYHIVHLLVRILLGYHAQVADIVQHAFHLLGTGRTLKLHQIDAHWQGINRQLVLKQLIGRLTRIGMLLHHFRPCAEHRLNLLVAFIAVNIHTLQVACLRIHPVHAHRHLRDATQVLQFHLTGTRRDIHHLFQRGVKTHGFQTLLNILQ